MFTLYLNGKEINSFFNENKAREFFLYDLRNQPRDTIEVRKGNELIFDAEMNLNRAWNIYINGCDLRWL